MEAHQVPLPCPWDSPGKNTGVGCHFLLQCMKVKSESEVAQLCPTLSDLMDCSPPGSSIHGIFQARVLEFDLLVNCEVLFDKALTGCYRITYHVRREWHSAPYCLLRVPPVVPNSPYTPPSLVI